MAPEVLKRAPCKTIVISQDDRIDTAKMQRGIGKMFAKMTAFSKQEDETPTIRQEKLNIRID